MSNPIKYGSIIFLLLTLILPLALCGQQRPYYTQYILNPFVSNPALSGIESYWDVKLSYRNQWSGIPGAPQTLYATAHGPLNLMLNGRKTTSKRKTHGRKSTVTRSKPTSQQSLLPHSGLGFSLVTDRAGPVDIITFNTAYAYHLNLTRHTTLSAGASAGLQTIRVRATELDFGTANPIDPVATNGLDGNAVKPDMSLGLWIYSPVYFVGLSAQNIIPSDVAYSKDGVSSGQMVAHTSFIVGYKCYVNERINFIPSAMIRYVHHTPFNFDVNAKLQFEKIGWLGISYRHSQSFAAMLGMNINQGLSFGYTYDITTARLKKLSNGAHEVVVGFLISKRSKVVLSPRNFW